ncbi:MAG TPA: amidohydrolase family protein [Stellaceae bacterium]|jgi:N-acyl-D-aspartate/D-glutamate deacylase
MLDTLIKDALIFDGSGAPPRRGSIGIRDGRIVDGSETAGGGGSAAREIVDAGDLALMPGIIDAHTHYDAQLTWDPYADPSISLGVTTVVIGNCGFTIAPCRPEHRDLTMRNLTQVEGMALDALRRGITWEFESFRDYMAMLDARGLVPNVAAFVGHSSIRTFVLGEDASRRAATDGELARMQDLVRDAMSAGAIGFASSTNEPHNGEGGIPMPSRLADQREFIGLASAMAGSGRGVFMLTKGSVTSIASLEEVAAEARRPIVVAAMLHDSVLPDSVFGEVDAMRRARERGHRLYPQVSCCPLTMEFTLVSAYVFEGLQSWRPAMQATRGGLAAVYAAPSFREAVRKDLSEPVGNRLFNGEWARIRVVETKRPENRDLEGMTIEELARREGKPPLDAMLDLAIAEDLETLFAAELKNSDEEAVGRLLRDPDNHIALSDAGAHLTFLCDADFGLHLLGHWVRDRQVMSLEEAVRRLTGQTASLFGITGRGRIATGCAADLLLFDPATVGRGRKRRAHDLPGGASRLVAEPRGVHGVWVNGVKVADATGTFASGARPGRLLREFT